LSQQIRPSWWPKSNLFLQRLREGSEPPVTLWVTLGSASVVELLAARRPDALLLDREHTTASLGDIQTMILAAENARVAALVRVPGPDRHEVGRLLDAGADGIVFPRVSTEAQAREAARSVKYPPRGTRGWAGTHARRTAWGGPHIVRSGGALTGVLSPAFIEAADAAVATIFMIEDPAGAAAIDGILDAGSPDAVIFGWADFTVEAGFDSAAVDAARARVYDACRRRGIGIALGTSAEDAAQYYPGCFISAGVEATLFSTAVTDQLDACREFGRRLLPEAGP
jgi:2-keto-3-deoxy-L-rhamnonate aldolase RhmA